MIVSIAASRVTVRAPAKVNLHLEVLAKRTDGYHEIETLMVAVSLFDTLIFRRQPAGQTIWCSEPRLGTGDENLVARAIQLVREQTRRTDGVHVHLTKRIPLAAGLAGGSTDAAATLMGLNSLWRLGWTNAYLTELGARLGSDVPFFFHTPAAIGRGRGDALEAVAMAKPLHMVLVSPPEQLSTAGVYHRVRPAKRPQPINAIISALRAGHIAEIARHLHNRLETPAKRLSRAVARVLSAASNWDSLGFRMSGSGSTVFAVCASRDRARQLAKRLQDTNFGRVFVVRTTQ